MNTNKRVKLLIIHKMYKKFKFEKNVRITIKSKEASSQLEPVRKGYVAIMHQLVTISPTM